MRAIVYTLFLVLAAYNCKSLKDGTSEIHQPITVEEFLNQPFGVNESVASFKKYFGNEVRLKKMIRRNKHEDQKVDTIFQFYHRKSKVFIYKTYFGREILLGGVITDRKFPLINGVVPGMKRDAFFKAFIDLEKTSKDSVVLNSKEMMREFTFIFNTKGILKKINFSSYVD